MSPSPFAADSIEHLGDPHPDTATRFLRMGNRRRRAWADAIKAAGVPDRPPYNGRDTYASLLIHEGRNPGAVAAALAAGIQTCCGATTPTFSTRAALAPNVPLEMRSRPHGPPWPSRIGDQ